MALRKRPIEKNKETPKKKNIFSASKSMIGKKREKPTYRDDKKKSSRSFDNSRKSISSSIKTESNPINKFNRKESSEKKYTTNRFSTTNNRTPFKKSKSFSNEEKEIKVYSSDRGKRKENNFNGKENRITPVNRFSKKNTNEGNFKKDKRDSRKPFERKNSDELKVNRKPYNRLPKETKKESPRFQKESRLNNKDLIKNGSKKISKSQSFKKEVKSKPEKQDELVRLNRYISNAGICSRREADKLISTGLVSVNGTVITEMGYQVKNSDDVRFNGQRLSREKRVYIIMNKPKDAIATLDDPEGRNTIMDLLGNGVSERVFPVGRLDRNTTGVIILTNDGELSQRLMHPKYEVEKVYKATLNKIFKGEDFWQLTNGVELEDGFIKPDELAYPDPKNKLEVGILIHSGRNRIIHRMFEHLGYLLDKLDRVSYGGFVKTGLKRGEWRHLSDKEVTQLKRLSKLG